MLIYRLLMTLTLPFVLARALWRQESLADLAERLGGGASGHAGVWLHGASIGELTSARWLLQDLMSARPGLPVLVTCNSLTARQMVRDWQVPGLRCLLAPLDVAPVLRRFLQRHQPRLLISLEAEVWPMRLTLCHARGIPVALLGARMSARSHDRWQRARGLMAQVLGGVDLASAQDEMSRRRLERLGLPSAAFAADLDLKAEAVARLPRPDLAPRAARAGWLLAASTHAGEEAIILDAFAGSRFDHLIIAPRHPSRAAGIVAALTQRGLVFGQRSAGDAPGDHPIYLADTLGEMDLWYARCGTCIIGGTFAPKGGHTPWEPARFGCALLHGPSTSNFSAPFARLDTAGGAVPVEPATLAAALAGMDMVTQDRVSLCAARVLQAQGDVSTITRRIFALFDA